MGEKFTPTLGPIYEEIWLERRRQDTKWGEQDHENGTGKKFERTRDWARDRCNSLFTAGTGTWFDILLEEVYEAAAEEDSKQLKEELYQVAAVAVAWIESIERKQPE